LDPAKDDSEGPHGPTGRRLSNQGSIREKEGQEKESGENYLSKLIITNAHLVLATGGEKEKNLKTLEKRGATVGRKVR